MAKEPGTKLCPVERAGALETPFRRLVQNPVKILKPFVKPGYKVLDFGCGPGFFTFDLARLTGESGVVYAADLQDGMLEKIRHKIVLNGMQNRVRPHKCGESSIGLNDNVDFILAFYMIHELPDQESTFAEFKKILNPGGRVLIIEPNFHVTGNEFQDMISKLEKGGFRIVARPKYFFSRSVLVQC
jgi:ubiquinone/menaquinone biosynthesis C-methylase UbiE